MDFYFEETIDQDFGVAHENKELEIISGSWICWKQRFSWTGQQHFKRMGRRTIHCAASHQLQDKWELRKQ